MFTRGDVLIVNDNLAHYRGGWKLFLTEIPNDERKFLYNS
ncbi:MAG: phospho-sugar glycosidase domain-containing protein [Thomasclavelia ramosa]